MVGTKRNYRGKQMNKQAIAIAALMLCAAISCQAQAQIDAMAQPEQKNPSFLTGVTTAPTQSPAGKSPIATITIPVATKNTTTQAQAKAKALPPAGTGPGPAIPPPLLSKNLPSPPAEAQVLPGLGVAPGEINEMRVKSIRVGSDRNELIYVSLSQLNKISTPFENPQIVDSSGSTAKAVGQDLFIQPVSDKPFTVYITDGGVGQSVGLTMIPRSNLPAQSFVVQPEGIPRPTAAKTADENIPSDYVSKLSAHIKQLAQGNTPSGFTKGKLPFSIAENAQTIFRPQHKFSGADYDAYSYKITSKSEAPIELSEELFYSAEVRAVAFYPLALLQKGEETTVFVISDHVGNAGNVIGKDVK